MQGWCFPGAVEWRAVGEMGRGRGEGPMGVSSAESQCRRLLSLQPMQTRHRRVLLPSSRLCVRSFSSTRTCTASNCYSYGRAY